MQSTALTATGGTLILCCVMAIGCGPASTQSTNATVEMPDLAVENQPSPESPAAPAPSASGDHSAHAEYYTVATYSEASEPTADLAMTVARAQAEHKRVILQVGGDWCGWCTRISKYMSTNKAVRETLDEHFLIMKVTFPGDNADDFLDAYPKCNGYPHFFVLDEKGEFLHSQGTGELEQGEGYDDELFMAFLTRWAS